MDKPELLAMLLTGHDRLRSSIAALSDEPFDLDARNAQAFEENRERTAADVTSGEAAAWMDLLGAIEAASEANLLDPARLAWTVGEPLLEITRGDIDRHWAQHPSLLGQSGTGASDEVR